MTLPLVPLVAAVDDPKLLGASLTPWPRQREILRAVERGPRIHVLAIGRRSGKSTLAALVCLHSCLLRPDLDAMVRPGETRYAVAVATSLSQARLIVSAARSIVERSPLLAPLLVASDKDGLTFDLGDGRRTALRAFPCTSRGGRGWPISTLVLDEAAHFIGDTNGDATAEQVWNALVPATAQFGDKATIIVSSTPWGDGGLFADLYSQASTGALVGSAAHHATTAEMNPTIGVDFLAIEQARDPVSFAAEYLAEFQGSGTAYLDFDLFEVESRPEALPREATDWIAGLDPAVSSDPFGVALVGRSIEDASRLVIGPVLALRASGSDRFARLLDSVADVVTEYGADAVTDQYMAPAIVERLRESQIAVAVNTMSAQSKTLVYGELRARLYDGTLELRDDHELVAELRRLRTAHTAGRASVVSPRVGGNHGDRAQALALAVDLHTRRGGTSHPIRSGRGGTITAGLLTRPL